MAYNQQPITPESEQELTNAIGQFLYQSIKEEWLSASITLSYLSSYELDNADKHYVCTAYYTRAFDPESNTQLEDKIIEATDKIKPTFEKLFNLAQKKSGKVWAEAIFSIERSGKFNLKFVDNSPFDE